MNTSDHMSMVAVPFLLYRGVSPISSLIRWQTRADYSHVAVIVPAYKYGGITRDTVVEAREFKGVRSRPYGGDDDRAAVFLAYATENNYQNATRWLFSQVGKGYDYTMVARFLTRRQESRSSTGKWFCSELAYAYASKLGLELFNNTQPWEVSPGLFARSPLIFQHRNAS